MPERQESVSHSHNVIFVETIYVIRLHVRITIEKYRLEVPIVLLRAGR